MNGITRSIRAAAKRRTLPLLLALTAAFGLGTPRPAAAQSPTPASPAVPTPYSWPGFHAGGASPSVLAPIAPYAVETPPAPDALFGMLQGTPTGLVTSGGSIYDAEIPSFLLGNYIPTNNLPDHFADDIGVLPSAINLFSAPFASVNVASSTTGSTVTVDDQSATGFATASGKVTTANGTTYNFAWQTGLADGTATDGTATGTGAKYSRVLVAVDPGGNPLPVLRNANGTLKFAGDRFAVATWTLTAPTTGTYSVDLNLPDPVDNSTTSTAPNKPEYRIPDAHYVITSPLGTVLADTRISQTETNAPQFLAGPFPLQTGESITVTLDNSTQTTVTDITGTGQTPANTYVLADSMTLTSASGATEQGGMQGSAVAVNATEYPEIANALYLGNVASYTTTPPTYNPDNINPFGNVTIGTTPPTTSPASTAERNRIRQLVYFGRSEDVVSQDANGELTAQPVGAIYCVDGNTGGVVWRYQTGKTSTIQNTGYLATGLAGTVKSVSLAGPQPFQIGPAANVGTAQQEGDPTLDTAPGTFGTYTAYDAAAPPITPADTARLGFSLYASATPVIVDATHVLYKGTFRIYDKAVTPDDGDVLEHGTFSITATFTDGYNATLSGTLTPDPGALHPPTWGYPVDFSHGTPPDVVNFTGQFQSDTSGNQRIYNAIIRAGLTSSTSPPGGFVFSTPTVARIHVLVGGTPTAPLYATKLVVIAADNLGYVYCLDAVGNRDGTANTDVIAVATNQPIYAPQPVFGAAAPVPVTDPAYSFHVGTTDQYWVYRPDPAKPKYISGVNIGKVKTYDVTSDLPVPGAFGQASPAIDVLTRIPYSAADTTDLPAAAGAVTGVAPDGTHDVSSAAVFIGNSNGTLYKLDALGTPLDGTLGDGTSAIKGDSFNASRDIRAAATEPVVPTPEAVWWLSTNADSAGGEQGTDSITSTPALSIASDAGAIHTQTQVYFTTANDNDNYGRLYRVDDKGATGAVDSTGAALVPGSPQYNTKSQATWGFPRAYRTGSGANQQIRNSLGSINGSPVLFTNPRDGVTHVYFAANVLQEAGDDDPLNAGEAGRIWCVDTDGTFNFAYPSAHDPNDYTQDAVTQPEPPIGGFGNATPAIGIVQFPTTIQYGSGPTTYAHTDRNGARDVKGAAVPMLYVGTDDDSDIGARLYGIDLDGASDYERTIYSDQAVVTGTSNDSAIAQSGLILTGGFVSSPALVTNSSTSGGNGGAVFITSSDDTLYQFQAAPKSNDTSATSQAVGPDFGQFVVTTTAGPYSSPAVAAFDATDLNGTTPLAGTTISGNTEVDFVYVGDTTTNQMLGITPSTITNFGSDGGFGGMGGGGGMGGFGGPARLNLPQFPLYVYLFDGTTAHPASSSNMSQANAIGAAIPAFEWGDSVYLRVANVVPPNPNDTPGSGTVPIAVQNLRVPVPGYANYFLTNGSPVSIQISETDRLGRIDVNRGADVGQVPAVTLADPPGLGTNPPSNGFVRDVSGDSEGNKFALKDMGTNRPWVGAYTYAIGDGSSRKNTPGSRRRIITATQTAQAWDNSKNPPVFISTVTLTATVSPVDGGHIDSVSKKYVFNTTTAVDQPTFAILNPLALKGSGLPIASISPDGNPQPIGPILGPFRAVTSPAPTNATDAQGFDAAAYSNGNRIYSTVADLPKNGVLSGNGTTTPVLHTQHVVTTTGLIGHGTSGGTTDANGNNLVGFGDRSDLGTVGKNLKITMMPTAMQWNDNSHAPVGSGTTGDWVNGEGSRINKLPWEDVPTAARAGQNHSLDYPDITPTAVRQVLSSNNGNATLTSSAAPPDPATGAARAQIVRQDSINVQLRVPKYQPANTQLYEAAAAVVETPTIGTPIAPQEGYNNALYNFPMGYTAQMRIFVDSDHNHVYTSGEAYRDLTVYTGVPMDMGTTITSATTDLGALTQGFGVQTLNFGALGAFDPYSGPYQSFFKPITAFNTGNLNLVNLQFDQRLYNTAVSASAYGLPFSAGPLDANAILSGYDMAGVTGPTQPRFTLRSSIDSDLINLTTPLSPKDPRNPGLTSTTLDPFTNLPYNTLYPGVTLHKARPGDGSPTVLRVPDVPYNNNVPAFYVAQSATGLPQLGTSAVPYIGMAVPIGTPVGTYSQNVRLFEGIDPTGFDPLKGPQYGGAYAGRGTPNTANLASALTITNGSPVQPYSTATRVVAKVEEVPITDTVSAAIALKGTLPHGDVTNFNTGDFSPSAFRNIFWKGGAISGDGNINLYWTSSRDANTTATSPPYNIVGKTLPYMVGGGMGYFNAANPNASWYQTIAPNPGPATNGVLFPNSTGLNTDLSVAKEPQAYDSATGTFTVAGSGEAYAFVQNTAAYVGSATGAPVYQSRIYCFPITLTSGALASGQLGATPSLASSDPAQVKFGVKGLKVASGTAFIDPLSPSNAPVTINRDLWAFWGSGARGRSSIGYTSTLTNGGSPGTWTPTASLPVPAGLSSTADPSPVLITAPDKNGNAVSAIDVTYTGIGPDGSADLFISRYRPYMVQNATGTATTTVGLALSPFPSVTETLQADTQVINWQARDVAWVRDTNTLDVTVNGTSLVLKSLTPQYDLASGTLVYTGVTAGPSLTTYPNIGTATVIGKVDTVYLDLVRGRVRFRIRQTLSTGGTRMAYSLPTDAAVTATFASEARRITADPIADTEPVTFLDEAFKPNEANSALTSGTASLGRVQANRAWYIWRKAALGKTGQPTLFYKTQRLTVVPLGQNNTPISSIALDVNGKPEMTVSFSGGTLYSPTAGGVADVDWARGRIYLPLDFTGKALEGQLITVSGIGITSTGASTQIDTTIRATWQDEGRYNDINFVPDDTSTAVPISTVVNEGTVSAFLDPMAYADVQAGAYNPITGALTSGATLVDQPHKVWLYWSSTRNGTADIYSEAIEPRFSVRVGGGSVP